MYDAKFYVFTEPMIKKPCEWASPILIAGLTIAAMASGSNRTKSYEVPIFVGGTEEAEQLKGRVKVIGGMDLDAPSTHEFLMEAL